MQVYLISAIFKLSDLALDTPSMVNLFVLVGAVWAGASRLAKITDRFTNIKRDLESANTATNVRVNEISYINAENFRRLDQEILNLKGEMKEQDAECRRFRNKLFNIEGYLAKGDYTIRHD